MKRHADQRKEEAQTLHQSWLAGFTHQRVACGHLKREKREVIPLHKELKKGLEQSLLKQLQQEKKNDLSL